MIEIKKLRNEVFLTTDSSCLCMDPPVAEVNGQAMVCKTMEEHTKRSTEAVGGKEGIVTSDRSVCGEVLVERRIFDSGDGSLCAMQVRIENISEISVQLGSVIPFQCCGDSALFIGNSRLKDCRFLKMGRNKLDIPGTFRPSIIDQDYLDAAFQAEKMTAGGGVQGNTDAFVCTDQIYAEPLCFLKSDRNPCENGIAFCSLGQAGNFTGFSLIPGEENQSLSSFYASCEFDQIRLEPGETRNTHWILFFEEKTEQQAIWQYTEYLKHYLGGKTPSKRSTLFCSWYFYGREFYETDLEENLKYLQEQPIPIDAFILDNGWMDNFGDWNANHKFPHGMQEAADKIRNAGMAAGIWTCPFLIMPKSQMFQNHPELIAKTQEGGNAYFQYVEGACGVVDTTHPFCEEYYHEMYGRLKNWGYNYHKLDFMRATTVDANIRFWDRGKTRAQAYRKGHELLREALGSEAYILSCGGVYDAADLGDGLVDSVRSGSDSIGSWEHPSKEHHAGTLVQIKQAMVRNYLNCFVNLDPDSLMLRRRETPFRMHETEKHNWLSDGKFTDAEVESLVAKQYICGGNVNFSERLEELPADRRKLLSLIIPPVAPPAEILDFDHEICPTLALSRICPQHCSLPEWFTLSVSNWSDEAETRSLNLKILKSAKPSKWAVLELYTQQFLGIFDSKQQISLLIPAHGTRILRITPWEGVLPIIAGTDVHLAGGAYELYDVTMTETEVRGRVETNWEYPVTVTAIFPDGKEGRLRQCCVLPGAAFMIKKEEQQGGANE
ncbi:MAG: alpha-galactosidase [Hungatella sp.]